MKTTSKQKTSIMKKIGTFIMALALVLGLSQCKKQETPATPDADGDMVYISVKANDGDRDAFYPNTGALVYGNGDKIYVGDGSKCLGFLTYNTGAFGGEFGGAIIEPAQGQDLYFYFIGGEHEIPWHARCIPAAAERPGHVLHSLILIIQKLKECNYVAFFHFLI